MESFVVMWMNLEPVIQSEVSQEEKNKYHILMHNMESRKIVLMKLFARKKEQRNNIEDRLVDTEGEGKGGMN